MKAPSPAPRHHAPGTPLTYPQGCGNMGGEGRESKYNGEAITTKALPRRRGARTGDEERGRWPLSKGGEAYAEAQDEASGAKEAT